MNFRLPVLLLAATAVVSSAQAQTFSHSKIFQHRSGSTPEQLGRWLLGISDHTGPSGSPDGHSEYVIGAPQNSRIYIMSGRTGTAVRTVPGFVKGDQFGERVCEIWDVDNDGVRDLLVAAPNWARSSTEPAVGRVAIISTKKGIMLRFLTGTGKNDRFGTSLALIGDINRDNVPDFAIGGAGYPNGAKWGRVRIFSGKDQKTVLKTFSGGGANEQFGIDVLGPGDLDGDNFPDIVISAFKYSKAFSMRFNVLLHTFKDQWAPLMMVSDLNGDKKPDLLLNAYRKFFAFDLAPLAKSSPPKQIFSYTTDYRNGTFNSGLSFAQLDDIDGDGTKDLALGQPYMDATYKGNGQVHVISGLSQRKLMTLTGEVLPTVGAAGFGYRMASADIDGDGKLDLLASQSGRQILGHPLGQTVWAFAMRKRILTTDKHTISLKSGGSVKFTINAPQHAGKWYYFAGSVSGYTPGFSLWGFHIPLNIDPYFDIIVSNPNGPILSSSFGRLDSSGKGVCTLKSVPGLSAAWKGRVIDHAAVILSPNPFIPYAVTTNRPVTMVQ